MFGCVLGGGSPSVSKMLVKRGGVCFFASDRTVTSVHDVSVSIPPTGITAFVGPSGAGKSTLCELICGIQAVSSGSIVWPSNAFPSGEITTLLYYLTYDRFLSVVSVLKANVMDSASARITHALIGECGHNYSEFLPGERAQGV